MQIEEIRDKSLRFFLSLWDDSTGGFRFATHQPATLMATAYCVLGLEFLGELCHLSDPQESAIISFFMAGAQPDGMFRDPLFQLEDILSNEHDLTYFQEETTTFCQQALDALLAPPAPPRDWPEDRCTPDGLIKHFESFSWQNPWLDSNRVMFVLSQLCHDAERHRRPELLELVDAALDWLDAHQNSETGLSHGPRRSSLENAMAATFHFTFYYGYRRRRLRYLERIIDSCLTLQQPHGLFSGNQIGHTCLDYDALDLLAKASLATDYLCDEVHAAMSRAYKALLALLNPDGGFAHCKEQLSMPYHWPVVRTLPMVRLSRFSPRRARIPVKGDYNVCWRMLSCESAQSNAFSTWFRLLALRLATQRQWLYANSIESFTFRRSPFLGYHDPLAVQSAHGIVSTRPLAKDEAWQSKGENAKLVQRPLVSVIIPAYNNDDTLPATLASLRAQTYPHWEGIIVNDGSTDKTRRILRHWTRCDKRFRVIDQGNKGLGVARNTALLVAHGDLVHCLDADDLIEPDFYLKVVSELHSRARAVGNVLGICLYSSYFLFRENGFVLGHRSAPETSAFSFDTLCHSNPGPPVTYIFERSILSQTGIFDETLRHCHDWDLLLRFARVGVLFLPVKEANAWYRVSLHSLSTKQPSFTDAAAEVQRRAAMNDARCASIQIQPSLLSPQYIEACVAHFWYRNLLRVVNAENQNQASELFVWARRELPRDFWTAPLDYGVRPTFDWAQIVPLPEKFLEAGWHRRLFLVDTFRRFWPELEPGTYKKEAVKWIAGRIVEQAELNGSVIHGTSWQMARQFWTVRSRQNYGLTNLVLLTIVALTPPLLLRYLRRKEELLAYFRRGSVGEK